MADERKYGEDEITEIFALATREGETDLPILREDSGEESGLTLGQLQEVGREVGVAPDRVAQAVATLDAQSEVIPRGRSLGATVSVGRVVDLPRAPTDREWQVIVADLRGTFRANGRVFSHAGVREWTNGRLHAFIEPTSDGYRLRLGTRKTGAEALTVAGAIPALLGVVLLLTSGLDQGTFGPMLETLIPVLMALGGGALVARNTFSLNRWADDREGQMEEIASRVRGLLAGPPE